VGVRAGGYRDPAKLASDLALVTRYVAINLLFASSPLYPPYLTSPRLPDALETRLHTYEGWDDVNASERYQTPELFRQEEGELFPKLPLSVDLREEPIRGRALGCYAQWLVFDPCYPGREQYGPFASLFVFNALERLRGEQTRAGTYTAAGFNYATNDDVCASFLGYADTNHLDGTQSMVFSFVCPSIAEVGYGLTTTQIHEFGHHFGMSHPHDGFDWETRDPYGPSGRTFFAWLGDEANSIMSYIDLNWDFSQFDRDNMARFQSAAYVRHANKIAGRILRAGKGERVRRYFEDADAAIGLAKGTLAAHDYPGAWSHARRAYELLLEAADEVGVKVDPSARGWEVQPRRDGKERPGFEYAHVDRAGPGTKRWAP
jgi:hypothetical protein